MFYVRFAFALILSLMSFSSFAIMNVCTSPEGDSVPCLKNNTKLYYVDGYEKGLAFSKKLAIAREYIIFELRSFEFQTREMISLELLILCSEDRNDSFNEASLIGLRGRPVKDFPLKVVNPKSINYYLGEFGCSPVLKVNAPEILRVD